VHLTCFIVREYPRTNEFFFFFQDTCITRIWRVGCVSFFYAWILHTAERFHGCQLLKLAPSPKTTTSITFRWCLDGKLASRACHAWGSRNRRKKAGRPDGAGAQCPERSDPPREQGKGNEQPSVFEPMHARRKPFGYTLLNVNKGQVLGLV
jgi:hypothetical protein